MDQKWTRNEQKMDKKRTKKEQEMNQITKTNKMNQEGLMRDQIGKKTQRKKKENQGILVMKMTKMAMKQFFFMKCIQVGNGQEAGAINPFILWRLTHSEFWCPPM